MMKIQMQPKKHEVAKHVFTTMLCMLAVLMVAFAPVTSALAIIQVETPEIVNTFVLGELGYKLVFDANKPANAPTDAQVSNMPVSADYEIEVAAASHTFTVDELPTLTGYQFMGWALTADATAANYPVIAAVEGTPAHCDVPVDFKEANQQYDADTATTTKTVYAVWKQMDFTVTFHSQVEDIAIEPAFKTVTYQLPYGELPAPVRPGYTFLGWTLETTGTDYITSESIVNIADNHDLYAQWQPNSYIVHFNANGGKGTMADQTFTYDVKDYLSANTFTHTGYSFMGWSDKPDGMPLYNDKQFVSNLTTEAEITLYACWAAEDDIVVTFESGYADSPATPLTKTVTYDQPYGTLATPPDIEGYKFLGWYTQKEGKGQHITSGTIVKTDEDHTLYAHWQTPQIDLLLMFPGSGNNNFESFAKHDYSFNEGITYTGQTISGRWESFSIRMSDLIVGGTYQLKFDASFSDRTCIRGYSNVEGNNNTDYPIGCTVDEESKYAEDGDTGGSDIYDWKPTNANRSTNDFVIEFVATKENMFWLWELSRIRNPGETYLPDWKEGVENFEESYFDLTLSDISLTLIDAYIDFEETTARTKNHDEEEVGSFKLNSFDKDTVNFNYTGWGGVYEKARIPINGLIVGQKYTVDYTLNTTANSSKFVSYVSASANLSNDDNYTGTNVFSGTVNKSTSGSFTFKATETTMYWIWGMTGVTNKQNYNYVIDATIQIDPNATLTTLSLNYSPLTVDLPGVTVTGADTLTANEPAVLTLTGSDIPDVLNVEVTGTQTTEPTVSTFALRSVEPVAEPAADEAQTVTTTLYMTGLNEELVNASAAAEGATAQAWITANADGSQTLILPAELMTEGATITITGASYNSYNLSEITYEHLN